MEKNFEYRKKEYQKMMHHKYECNVSTPEFFCAYKCGENHQLKRHIENHRRAIAQNKSERNTARFYEFPNSMLDEIKGMFNGFFPLDRFPFILLHSKLFTYFFFRVCFAAMNTNASSDPHKKNEKEENTDAGNDNTMHKVNSSDDDDDDFELDLPQNTIPICEPKKPGATDTEIKCMFIVFFFFSLQPKLFRYIFFLFLALK